MKGLRIGIIFVLSVVLMLGVRQTFAQSDTPNDTSQEDLFFDKGPFFDEPIVNHSEARLWVENATGTQGKYVTVEKVELVQSAVLEMAARGLPQTWTHSQTDDIVYSGNYVMTMVRWLKNQPDWLGRPRVSAGGSTTTNVTAEELRVHGTHYWGASGCNNSGLSYTGYDYNTISVSRETQPALMGGNQWHCVKNGEHKAKINGDWPFWVEGQEGPTAYW